MLTELSLYKNARRISKLYYRHEANDFLAMGYEDDVVCQAHSFDSEFLGEDWCEDWVMNYNLR